MKSGEGHHVDGQFAKVGVQLAGEPQAGGDSRHREGHQVVEITVGRGGEFQGPEADVVQRLIVDTVSLIRVFDQLVHG